MGEEPELLIPEGGKVDPLVPMMITIPDEEGVYEIVISVYRKKTFRNTFVRSSRCCSARCSSSPLLRSRVRSNRKPWKLIDTIDPNHASWMEWLTRVPKLPLLPDFRQEPLGNDKSSTIRHSDQELVELAPGGWQAYPLSIETAGKPHMLEIEYPNDLSQTMGISIIEPNAVGKVVPLGLDSGVDVPDRPSVEQPRIRGPQTALLAAHDDSAGAC